MEDREPASGYTHGRSVVRDNPFADVEHEGGIIIITSVRFAGAIMELASKGLEKGRIFLKPYGKSTSVTIMTLAAVVTNVEAVAVVFHGEKAQRDAWACASAVVISHVHLCIVMYRKHGWISWEKLLLIPFSIALAICVLKIFSVDKTTYKNFAAFAGFCVNSGLLATFEPSFRPFCSFFVAMTCVGWILAPGLSEKLKKAEGVEAKVQVIVLISDVCLVLVAVRFAHRHDAPWFMTIFAVLVASASVVAGFVAGNMFTGTDIAVNVVLLYVSLAHIHSINIGPSLRRMTSGQALEEGRLQGNPGSESMNVPRVPPAAHITSF